MALNLQQLKTKYSKNIPPGGILFQKVSISKEEGLSKAGRGAWRDDMLGERLWRIVKYELISLKTYDSISAA